ncbi:MBL fold metallo-hydrolase [Lampropedia cohaerens]|uniref:MBL fold metallo-hydrolase n=1 Tax=Lampropedia cohaerens TaxID=1610491 RepID=UPI000A95AFBD|nr:MBL fold metallo-hydrolase [Lampropedia cohaerens]
MQQSEADTVLRFRSLASGSSANATLVEGHRGSGDARCFRALIDCGLNLRQLRERLACDGLAPEDLHAIFVTHEHSDHVGACFELAAKWHIPLWTSYGTWLAAGAPQACSNELHIVRDGQAFAWGAMQVVPFTVPHDAREPLQLRITQGGCSLALLTDLGHVTGHVRAHVSDCQAVLLEFNHEPHMLAASRYPAFLKRRIAGRQGHLSNEAAAELLGQMAGENLRHVVAGHLSRQNNRPDLAAEWIAEVIGHAPIGVHIASQDEGCAWVQLSGSAEPAMQHACAIVAESTQAAA